MDPRLPIQRNGDTPYSTPCIFDMTSGGPRPSPSQIKINRRTQDYDFPNEPQGIVTDIFMHRLMTKHLNVEPFNKQFDEMYMMPMVFMLTAGRFLMDESTVIDEDKCHITTMAEMLAPVMPDRLYIPQDEARDKLVDIVKFLMEECRSNRIDSITTASPHNFEEWLGHTYDDSTREALPLKSWPTSKETMSVEEAVIILRHMGHLCFLVPMRYRVYLALHVFASIAKQGMPTPIFIRCIRVFTLTELKVDLEYNLDHIRMFYNTYKRYFIRSTNDEILSNVCKRCKHLLAFRPSPKLIHAIEESMERKYSSNK